MAKKPKFPAHIVKKADKVIGAFYSGKLHARKMHLKDRLTLDINPFYRLLSFDAGKTWELLTHEDYNKHVNRIV